MIVSSDSETPKTKNPIPTLNDNATALKYIFNGLTKFQALRSKIKDGTRATPRRQAPSRYIAKVKKH